MNIFALPGIESTSAALAAERLRMEIVTQNLANTSTTRGVDGKPYQRQYVVFENVLRQRLDGSSTGMQTLRVAKVEKDQRPPRTIEEKGHPDADANGMVSYPDIDVHREMVDLIASSRAYEANLTVVKNARQMALQTLNIGKR
jgi:flagellar basal-body rod protein FlgC